MAKRWTQWNAEHARTVLDEFDGSGLSLAEFARRRGIQPSRIRRWRARLDRAEEFAPPRLVELIPSSPPRASLRVHCPSGHVVELDDADLERTLRVLLAATAEART